MGIIAPELFTWVQQEFINVCSVWGQPEIQQTEISRVHTKEGRIMPSLFLFLSEPITKTTRIKGKDYETIKLIWALEKIIGKKIVTNQENRLVRRYHNTTIEVSAVIPTNGEPLRIASKEGFVELYPSF